MLLNFFISYFNLKKQKNFSSPIFVLFPVGFFFLPAPSEISNQGLSTFQVLLFCSQLLLSIIPFPIFCCSNWRRNSSSLFRIEYSTSWHSQRLNHHVCTSRISPVSSCFFKADLINLEKKKTSTVVRTCEVYHYERGHAPCFCSKIRRFFFFFFFFLPKTNSDHKFQ